MSNNKRGILDMNAFDARNQEAIANPLLKRRTENIGAASVLFYKQPIEMVSASGCWMTDAAGVRYLDFYNNVPSVGHCHPQVSAAIAKQLATLNTNSRYLSDVTESYLEKLKSTLPSTLKNVVMTCSGSEANDLAMRIAKTNTGSQGFIVTSTAYHGNTEYVTQVSPSALKNGSCPDYVVTVPAPCTAAFGNDVETGFNQAVAEAIALLKTRGYGIAALLCDSIFSSDGVFSDPAGFLKPAIETIHQAGGLYIADEVQPGFGRTGDCFWGFQRHNVIPDMVTMGKPMGNGYPVAALVVKPDLLETFCHDVGYFNTFGGTPAAAAAAMAVMDVIEQEGLQANAKNIGGYLKQQLTKLSETDLRIGEVRGAGLFIGLDLCDPLTAEPSPSLATQVINGLRDEHVLIGAAGPYGHTLKIRPPLCLNLEEADYFIEAIKTVLGRLPS